MASSMHLFLSLFLLLLITSANGDGDDRTEIPGAIDNYDIQDLGRTAAVEYDYWDNRDTSWLHFCRVIYAAQKNDDHSVYFLTLLAYEETTTGRSMNGYDAILNVNSNSRVPPNLASFVPYPDQGGFMGDGQHIPLLHPVDCYVLDNSP